MIKHLLLALLAGLALAGCTELNDKAARSPAVTALPESPPRARLPALVKPTHYALHLDIDPRKDAFSGRVTIDVLLTADTKSVWLHGRDLQMNAARAILADGSNIALSWEQVTPTGVAKLSAASTLPAGAVSLQFEYQAPFNTSLEGLYKVNQGSSSYAFSQFQATSARLAFPSFDEPAFKVAFDISLSVPQEYVAITNSPQLDETLHADGTRTLTFARTKPLPTYLVAFAVGPFDVVEWDPVPANNLRAKPLPLRGLTTRGKGDEIRFALENTAAILTELETYFDTPYPYAKLDIIAVPDFSAGAMENAGAITYREQLILLDDSAPISQKRGYFITHTHELAHQWFGNLVTPVWWDDLWLNEAFAQWNSHIILDQLYPGEKYRESLHSSASRVMRIDSLATARQIREPIERHEDISSAFNGITYQKGGGVLLMFESFLGSDNFRAGVRQYMKTFAFGNTTAEDFITAIAQANPQVETADLRAAFQSFIAQPGLPLISSQLHCNEDSSRLVFNQERYLPAGSQGSTEQTWIIPACIRTVADAAWSSQCFLLKNPSESIALTSGHCPDAIMPNANGSGYYRWSMPPEGWSSLLAFFDQLSAGEQISVASSLSAALNNSSMSLSEYMDAVPTIATSRSWRVAMAPLADIYRIKEFLADEDEKLRLEARIKEWYQPQLDRLRAIQHRREDEDQFLARTLSALALGARDPDSRRQLAASGAAYAGFQGNGEINDQAIDPNLRLLGLKVAAEEFGKPYTDLLWRHFTAADNAQLRQYLLVAMASSPDPGVAALMRSRILSPQLRDNEIYPIIGPQMSRGKHRQAMWEWSMANIEPLLGRIPAWKKGKLAAQFDDFCSLEQADEIESFFTPMIGGLEAGPRSLANALETIRLCAAFVDHHEKNTE